MSLERNNAMGMECNPEGVAGLEQQFMPEIIFDQSLEDAPYTIEADREECASFLKHIGMADEEIKKSKIRFSRGCSSGRRGQFFMREMTVYTEPFWSGFIAGLERVNEILNDKIEIEGDPFNRVLYTKKLTGYLLKAPTERGIATANKLLLNAAQRELNATFAHEGKHALDYSDNRLCFWLGSIGVKSLAVFGPTSAIFTGLQLSGFPELSDGVIDLEARLVISLSAFVVSLPFGAGRLIRKITPAEIVADNFKKKLRNDPRWRSLIKIIPKETDD